MTCRARLKPESNTALILGCWRHLLKGHAAVVSLLLEAGAKLGAVNNKGESALQLAECKGHAQAAEASDKQVVRLDSTPARIGA